MDMEEVEGFGFEDFEHFGGEGEGVGRMVEERVGDDFDFVEMDARVIGVHANGRGVADEMDVVAAGGEFHAELGGDYARAAVGGVTRYAYAHRMGFEFSSSQFEPLRYNRFECGGCNYKRESMGLKTRYYDSRAEARALQLQIRRLAGYRSRMLESRPAAP
jgi:hypothetical protein